jgi:hypothetical protein
MLAQDIGEFHEAFGAPLVAEFGIGKFVDSPVGVGGDVTHARLLVNGLLLEMLARDEARSIPQEALK